MRGEISGGTKRMERKQDESPATIELASGKKLYHKPVVSVYGTLTDVTKAGFNPPTHNPDGTVCWGTPGTVGRT